MQDNKRKLGGVGGAEGFYACENREWSARASASAIRVKAKQTTNLFYDTLSPFLHPFFNAGDSEILILAWSYWLYSC